MTYEVLNHACVKITGSKILYFDPFGLKDAPRDADIIFVTHDHYDHLSPEDIEKVSKPVVCRDDASFEEGNTVMVLPESVADVDGHPCLHFAPGTSGDVLGVAVEAVPAYNPHKMFHPKKNGWLGYVVTLDGKRFYIAGDTDETPEAAAVRCDIAFIPVGGKYTCNAEEAAELAKKIAPAECAVPYHFGAIVGTEADRDRFLELTAK